MKGNSSALRRGRYSETDQIYHVTFTTHNRRPLFQSLKYGRDFIQILKIESGVTDTLAFVVMPDHVHWLLQLRNKSLSKTVQTVKSMSTRYINLVSGSTGAIWQPGFHDHAIRSDEYIVDIARYIVMNPVRAGLVRSVREYPHWDAVWV